MAPTTENLPDTPVMRQYQELKSRHPADILFFRLGDFYEMFGDDARVAAPILGLILTARQGVPMCGIPWHNKGRYIAKLLKSGHKVAVAEQVEGGGEPQKKIFRREIVRVITPGTVIEDDLLEPSAVNYLAAIETDLVGWGFSCIDVSTGEFWASQALNDRESRKLLELIARVRPSEILADERTLKNLGLADLRGLAGICLTRYDPALELRRGPAWINDPFWGNHPLARRAAFKCCSYLDESKLYFKEILAPAYRESCSEMLLDETAIRTLELVESSSGEKSQSLWGLLDRASTAMGSRKIKEWILHPSTDLPEIELRQNAVEELADGQGARAEISSALREISDLPRLINRLGTREAGPRDLAGIRDSLACFPAVGAWLRVMGPHSAFAAISSRWEDAAAALEPCRNLLDAELAPEPPARIGDGGIIRTGIHPELDELRLLKSDGNRFLEELQERERKSTGISSLKAGYNSVFGYYFEVTKAHQDKVPHHYVRKQTLTNAERYITSELKDLENRILGAEDKILRLEARLFEELRERACRHRDAILRSAHMLAELDGISSLAQAACLYGLVKPAVDLSYDLHIDEGRHPILSALAAAGSFVPNSIAMDGENPRIIVLTGPNMAGKSTYLRQNALIALMAQIGSFVPAKSAKIGIVDRILTRIGAQDAIARGDSTFMVEMKETAHILRAASPRSLLILDEVGRGTSTFDGISIAWAVLEHLNKGFQNENSPRGIGPRVLFATHYFELTELSRVLSGIANFNVEVKEWTNAQGRAEIVFLHKISPGSADRSYGIHVAALAGLPPQVIARAREILERLESESASGRISGSERPASEEQLPLFNHRSIIETLRLLNPERMTPMEALAALVELKKGIS
ncbi:MAG: DNA mismatch repair protein MutS [Elusimicrobiota bacterium]